MDLGRVRRLPDDLVNKIAAGEVVERPASVVKELVENALDAGARSVQVDIEGGGRDLIRVRDDGHGMSAADASLAIERHATSKLASLEDLSSIATCGFRGEALPSIAAVSRLVLRTRQDETGEGTEVEVTFGALAEARPVGHPRGTTVEVRDLFGSVPARRKFLRADSTETGHVAEVVTQLALAHPSTGFWLRSGGRRLVEAAPADGLAGRLYQLFGDRIQDDLVKIEPGGGDVSVTGFVSRPEARRPARGNLRLFVNGRPVRDRGLARAVAEAYRMAGGDGAIEAFVFVELPPAGVDVNVHPAKTEVRFAEPRKVYAAVEAAVRVALSAGGRGAPAVVLPWRGGEAAQGSFLERRAPWESDRPGAWPPGGIAERRTSFGEGSLVAAEGRRTESGEPPVAPRVLGQHRHIYIVATDGEELVLVDQHTAHERVRFEGIVLRLAARGVEIQRLLVPAVMPLPPELLAVLDAHADALADLGFEVDAFGGGSVRLRSVPALLGGADPGPSLERLLRDLLERGDAGWSVSGTRERLAATLACHSAVRAGEGLALDAMQAIVRDLWQTAHPSLCPHGRPTMVRIPRDDLSGWFGRGGWRRR